MSSGLSSHSMHAMPILIINMGGEMLYILHQRLRAQSVDVEKERKVLRDVLMSMFSPLFIDELFKPQCMYSPQSTMQIFEKLAHSSIMRLNKSSMDKLYDLMAMGVKYQLLSCSSPQQYLHVTLNHLQSMRNIIGKGGDPVPQYLQRTEEHLQRVYNCKRFSSGDWCLLKTSLLAFYQGKKIKVSLFLQKKLQNPVDGTLSLSTNGPLPNGTEAVGTTRVFENGYLVKAFTQPLISQERERDRLGAGSTIISASFWDPTFTMGHNMYSTTSSMFGSDSATSDGETREVILRRLQAVYNGDGVDDDPSENTNKHGPATGASGSSGDSKVASPEAIKMYAGNYATALNSDAARAEAKMNAALFRSSSSISAGAKPVSLTSLLSGGSGFDFESKRDSEFGFFNLNIEEIDGAADAKTMDDMLEALDLKDAPRSSPDVKGSSGRSGAQSKAASKSSTYDDDDDDDLLALMDSAK